MRRLILSVAGALILVASASEEGRASDFYLQLDGGGSFFADNDAVGGGDIGYEPGYTFGGRLGYEISSRARAEIDLSYSSNDVDELADLDLDGVDVNISTFNLSLAAYHDLFSVGPVTSYAGGGVGVALWNLDVEVLGVDFSDDETDFTAHLEAGASLDFIPGFSIVPHYRLIWIDGIGDDEQLAHWLRLGFRYNP